MEEYIGSKFIDNYFEPFMIKIGIPIFVAFFTLLTGASMFFVLLNVYKLAMVL